MTRWSRALTALASVALGVLAACSGGDSNAPDCDAIAAALVSRIEVRPPSATVNLGDSLQLSAVAYSCAGPMNEVNSFTWRSANNGQATVSPTGLVKAVTTGGAVAIFAAAQGKEGSSAITTRLVPVARVTVEPATATVGVNRTSTLTARAFDAQDREITGRTVAWSSANIGTVTVDQTGRITGVAPGGPVAVTATIEGVSAAAQISVALVPVSTVTVAPATATIAAGTTQQFTATLRDELGNALTGRAVNWTSSDANIASVNASTGLATGNRPGTVTITATSEGRSSTAQLTVNIGAPAKLAFVQQPSGVQAGSVMSTVTVEIQDAAGNRVTTASQSVTLALTSPGGATLGGNTATAVNGLATFNNLTVSAAGTYTLTASSPGLTNATSSSFVVTARPAVRVAFVQQPTIDTAGKAITPAITVELQDATGARVTTSGVPITIAIGTNPGSSTLGGTVTQNTVNGVATFSDLSLNKTGTGYTLTASATGLTSATSTAFNILPGAPAKLRVVTQPCAAVGTCAAGTALTPSPQFEVLDANDNRVTTGTGSNASVTVALSGGPGNATLTGTTTVISANGLVTFGNLLISRTGTGFILTASSTGLTSTATAPFTVGTGTGSLSITTAIPASVVSGSTLPTISVQLLDLNGAPLTTAGVGVTLSLSPSGSLSATTPQLTNASGVATFSGVTISAAAGTGYSIVAAATGYASDASNTFAVTAPLFTLTVAKAGAGSGTVTSNPTGISCGADCSQAYASGTVVTLTAAPSANSTFTGWSGGGCSGTGTCVVTVSTAATVTATFALQSFTLTVAKAGAGTGTVTSNIGGINCGATCAANYVTGTTVVLTAAATTGSTFAGWSGGGCTGTGTCSVTLTAATTVTATFTLQSFTLSVATAGTGTVTSNPTGINCGVDCTEPYTSGTVVTLTATPGTGYSFGSWTGCPSPTGATCVETMTANTSVTASFISNPNITTPTLSPASVGSPYTQTLAVTGGVSPYAWSLAAGDTLPTGLALSAAGVISGTPTAAGQATFTVQVSDAGSRTDTQAYTLDVAAAFVGGASQLGFLVQPTNVNASAAISPPVQVEVRDANGSRVTSSTATVVMVFGNNAGNATLTGNVAQASAGVATFSNLRVSAPGNGYTLLATSDGLGSATSASFRVR